MTALRRLFLDRFTLSACLIALALAMKIIVPAGYMPVVSASGITIAICSGVASPKAAMTMKAAMPGMAHHGHAPDQPVKDMPCAFSGLSAPSLAAADPVLLEHALAFIVALAFRTGPAERVLSPLFLRPFLRGPPAHS